MTGGQNSFDENHILYLTDTDETFTCKDAKLNITSTYTCAQRTHVRPTETTGGWWYLAPRLAATSSDGPPTRAYHASASLASNSACMYVFGGRDYEISVLYSDLWKLCAVDGYLGTSEDTFFYWTELSPTGDLPKGR